MSLLEVIQPLDDADSALSDSPKPRRWTRQEYYRMAEVGLLAPDVRTELIGGEVLVMPRQNTAHFSGVCRGYAELCRIFGQTHFVRQQGPLAIGDDSDPEPDLAVVPGTLADYEAAHPTTALLVLEVSDTSLRLDRGRKAGLYARAGIPDYWIADLVNRRVGVRRNPVPVAGQPFGHAYAMVSVHFPGDTVAPLSAPDSAVAVSDLLPPET